MSCAATSPRHSEVLAYEISPFVIAGRAASYLSQGTRKGTTKMKRLTIGAAIVTALTLGAAVAFAETKGEEFQEGALLERQYVPLPPPCGWIRETKTKPAPSITTYRWSGTNCERITQARGVSCRRSCFTCIHTDCWHLPDWWWWCGTAVPVGRPSVVNVQVSTNITSRDVWVSPDCTRETVTRYSSACGSKTSTDYRVVSDSYCDRGGSGSGSGGSSSPCTTRVTCRDGRVITMECGPSQAEIRRACGTGGGGGGSLVFEP